MQQPESLESAKGGACSQAANFTIVYTSDW